MSFCKKIEARNGYEIYFLDTHNARFERHGEAIGHLIFDRLPGGQLELVDYDGTYALPKAIAAALRANEYHVDTIFD